MCALPLYFTYASSLPVRHRSLLLELFEIVIWVLFLWRSYY